MNIGLGLHPRGQLGPAHERPLPEVPLQRAKLFALSHLLGHTYMTSALGGGGASPKNRQKNLGWVNCLCDKGEGVKKSEYFADVI